MCAYLDMYLPYFRLMMYFKLSARELEILESQRQIILGTLLQHQTSGRARTQKPPFLVVPIDPSGLVCIITLEEDPSQQNSADKKSRCNKHLHSKVIV